MMLLASTASDDWAFAWAFVLAIPMIYLSLVLYVPAVVAIAYSAMRRYVGAFRVLISLIVPPALVLAVVECRNGPGWMFLLTVIALPLSCAYLLWYGLTAGRWARRRAHGTTKS